MKAKQLLHKISSQMGVVARELPDNTQIDILSMFKLTFGQSKESFINKYGQEVFVYDNGLTITQQSPKLHRYEVAMFKAFRQEDTFFIDPSHYIFKKVGFLHRGVLRRYKELLTILQGTEKSIDEESGNLYSNLSDSIDGYEKRIYIINSGNRQKVLVDKYSLWMTTLQGKGMATSVKRRCKLLSSCNENKTLPLVKGDYVCFKNNKRGGNSSFPILIENTGKEQLIIYMSNC